MKLTGDRIESVVHRHSMMARLTSNTHNQFDPVMHTESLLGILQAASGKVSLQHVGKMMGPPLLKAPSNSKPAFREQATKLAQSRSMPALLPTLKRSAADTELNSKEPPVSKDKTEAMHVPKRNHNHITVGSPHPRALTPSVDFESSEGLKVPYIRPPQGHAKIAQKMRKHSWLMRIASNHLAHVTKQEQGGKRHRDSRRFSIPELKLKAVSRFPMSHLSKGAGVEEGGEVAAALSVPDESLEPKLVIPRSSQRKRGSRLKDGSQTVDTPNVAGSGLVRKSQKSESRRSTHPKKLSVNLSLLLWKKREQEGRERKASLGRELEQEREEQQAIDKFDTALQLTPKLPFSVSLSKLRGELEDTNGQYPHSHWEMIGFREHSDSPIG
jgi:hypothetical protein